MKFCSYLQVLLDYHTSSAGKNLSYRRSGYNQVFKFNVISYYCCYIIIIIFIVVVVAVFGGRGSGVIFVINIIINTTISSNISITVVIVIKIYSTHHRYKDGNADRKP